MAAIQIVSYLCIVIYYFNSEGVNGKGLKSLHKVSIKHCCVTINFYYKDVAILSQ